MKTIAIDRGRLDQQKDSLRRFFEKRLGIYQREVRAKSELAAIRVAQDLAEATFPSSGAIGMAVKAIRFDVGQVFITPGRAFEILRESAGERVAGAFYAAYKNGAGSRALQVIRQSNSPIRDILIGTLRPELHESARSKATGRVVIAAPRMIVSKGELDDYLTKVVARLGKTASGWNACASKLGGSEGPTRWKSTAVHGDRLGRVAVVEQEGRIVQTIANLSPQARSHISPGQVAAIRKRGAEYLRDLLAE